MTDANPTPREPGLLSQVSLLVLAGITLGLLSDLALPGGAIANRAVVMRDLMAQVSVKLHTPEEATQLHLEGEIVLLDARPREESQQQRAVDSIAIPLELLDRYQEELIALFTGRVVLVVLEADRSEEARELAARLVSGYSAARAGTIEGGWEAFREVDDLVFVDGEYDITAEGTP